MLNLVRVLFFILLFFSVATLAQQPSQTIRGTITDKASNAPVPFANVVLLNSNPLIGTTTDTVGNFKMLNIPVGRYDIQVSYMGYEPSVLKEVLVSSAKETVLYISLKENSTLLEEVRVKPNVSKEAPINTMATVSARMLSVEEASRYAGGFDDPARLAASFAGVASNVGNNGIAVRGNSPKSLQWKLEGVEIPNPNHFADLSSFGGGGLTALSTKMLANSDFFTGAFPAEYSNALSGVFDIFMRTGNNERHEHSFQLGVIGIEASSEGPFKKGGRSSYLFNYRYSTLGLLAPVLPENAGVITYQDLSFKLNFPTKKVGIFSIWGIGLTDGSGALAKTDSSKWYYYSDKETQKVKQFMAASGISHKYFFNGNTFMKTTLAATVSGLDFKTERLDNTLKLLPENEINNTNWNFVLSSFLNTKTNKWHSNRTGIIATGLLYDLVLRKANSPGALQTIANQQGFSTLISVYTNSTLNLSEKLTMNIGLNGQIFTLNHHYTVEPRIGLKWKFKSTQSVGLAYGLHSRLEKLNYYFAKNAAYGNGLINKDVDFQKAHHFVLRYDWTITENIHFYVEPYFQWLFNVPVVQDSSFSFINLQNEWFFSQRLVNTGKGRNYGLDLTLEQYLKKGFYWMITASAFNSEYMGGDGLWRNTRFNRNYLFNFLVGKEWQFGKTKHQILGLNFRACYQGGDRYTPVNQAASIVAKEVIYNQDQAFSEQFPASFSGHLTIIYKINRKKAGHEIGLKFINITMFKEYLGYQYNYKLQSVDQQREAIFIPNLSYKVEF